MSPWPPEGEASGKGTKAVSVPRPGTPTSPARSSSGSPTRATRSSARARGTPPCRGSGRRLQGASRDDLDPGGGTGGDGGARTPDRRGARRPRHGRRRGRGARAAAFRPGSARTRPRRTRLDARLAAALMGIQAVKGVEIGDGFALAELRGSQAHDEIARRAASGRPTAPAGSRPASPTAKTSSSARR